jgi:hypothetical protein
MEPKARSSLPTVTIVTVTAGASAAWIASGSLGLLAEPLRIALTWLALFVATLVLPARGFAKYAVPLCAVAFVAARIWLSPPAVHELLFVVVVLSLLAATAQAASRTALTAAAVATFVLCVYRLALPTVPWLWSGSNLVGGGMGTAISWLTSRPLRIGATFSCLDLLLWMIAFVLIVRCCGALSLRGFVWSLASIVVAHTVYLGCLAWSDQWLGMLPEITEPEFIHPYVPPDWQWAKSAAQMIPWQLPWIAAVAHGVALAGLLYFTVWPASAENGRILTGAEPSAPRRLRWLTATVPLALAILLPPIIEPRVGGVDLTGQRIVAYEHGLGDWNVPLADTYGKASAGMFGLLPSLVQSVGGQMNVTPNLTAEVLAEADLLLMLLPIDSISAPERQQVWEYVRRGGRLLVVGGPEEYRETIRGSWNDILADSSTFVRRDVARGASDNWQHALSILANPAARAVCPNASYFFGNAGASLDARWPARPLVAGRWGWSDPGSDAVTTGHSQREEGERLGDLVLAAEQSIGSGRVMVLGDAYSFTNEGSVRAHAWSLGLLNYLCNAPPPWQTLAREAVGLIALLTLLLTAVTGSPTRLAAVSLVLAASSSFYATVGHQRITAVPQGRLAAGHAATPKGIAYIDASHLGAYSDLDWGFDAFNGLALNLNRNGYLTLSLPEITSRRLAAADLLVLISPAKPFSRDERNCIREFVSRGGTLVCTVGAEDAAGSQSLLAEFDLSVPRSPVPTSGNWREPEPMGRFRAIVPAPDPSGHDQRGVAFYAGWPVVGDPAQTQVLVTGQRAEPIIVLRQLEQGQVVLIGDSQFPLNKNLEYITGDPFDGGYENAEFWHWLLRLVDERPGLDASPGVAMPPTDANRREETK